MSRLLDWQARLKAAARGLVHLCGGVEAASVCCRVGPSQLAAAGSINEAERFMPVDVVAALEREIGKPVVTEALAALAGYRLEPVRGQTSGRVAEAMAAVFSGSGDIAAAYAMAVADGEFDDAEREQLRHGLTALLTRTAEALARLSGGEG